MHGVCSQVMLWGTVYMNKRYKPMDYVLALTIALVRAGIIGARSPHLCGYMFRTCITQSFANSTSSHSVLPVRYLNGACVLCWSVCLQQRERGSAKRRADEGGCAPSRQTSEAWLKIDFSLRPSPAPSQHYASHCHKLWPKHIIKMLVSSREHYVPHAVPD
jgi:hypothetical protein